MASELVLLLETGFRGHGRESFSAPITLPYPAYQRGLLSLKPRFKPFENEHHILFLFIMVFSFK